MPDPITIKDIQEIAGALDRLDIKTLGDLRSCISKDVDKSILWLSAQPQIRHPLLVALLLAEFDDDTSLSGKRKLSRYWRALNTLRKVLSFSRNEIVRLWNEKKSAVVLDGWRQPLLIVMQLMLRQSRFWHNRRRHWADAVLIIILPLLLLSLALRAQYINNRNVRYVTVRPGVTLSAFQKLSGDLVLKNVPYAKGAFNSIDDVVGRYILVDLSAGATLSGDQILNSDLSKKMQDRRILSVPLKAGTYVSTMKAPCEALMVLSSRDEDQKGLTSLSFDVIVLRFDKNGEATSTTVAIQKDNFEKASALLASHDAFLAQLPQ